jgi:hypothetical protein
MNRKQEDLSRDAGVRISPARPEDNGTTHFEMFVKATGEVVTRHNSFSSLLYIVRGKDRRIHPRQLQNERRALMHRNSNFYTVHAGEIVLTSELQGVRPCKHLEHR